MIEWRIAHNHLFADVTLDLSRDTTVPTTTTSVSDIPITTTHHDAGLSLHQEPENEEGEELAQTILLSSEQTLLSLLTRCTFENIHSLLFLHPI